MLALAAAVPALRLPTQPAVDCSRRAALFQGLGVAALAVPGAAFAEEKKIGKGLEAFVPQCQNIGYNRGTGKCDISYRPKTAILKQQEYPDAIIRYENPAALKWVGEFQAPKSAGGKVYQVNIFGTGVEVRQGLTNMPGKVKGDQIVLDMTAVGGEAETVLERTPAGIRLADGTTWSKLSFGPFNQRLQEQYGTSAGQQLLPQYDSGSRS